MFGLGMPEILIVLLIVVVLFGATKLPQLGKGMGEFIRNFKKSTNEPNEIDVTPKKSETEDKAEDKKT